MTARDVEVIARALHGAKPTERIGPSFNQWLRCVVAVARGLEYRVDRPARFDLAAFLTLTGKEPRDCHGEVDMTRTDELRASSRRIRELIREARIDLQLVRHLVELAREGRWPARPSLESPVNSGRTEMVEVGA